MYITSPADAEDRCAVADGLGLLPARLVADRYKVSDRTVDRWLDDPRLAFPRPIVINRRRYFRVAELIAWEHERAASARTQLQPAAASEREAARAAETA
jgi:hypothetical protein